MTELKPCPMCESGFKMGQEPTDNHPVAGMFYLYHDYGPLKSPARSCILDVPRHFKTEAEAIAAWNRRATPASPDVAARAAEVVAVDHSALFAKLVEAEAKAHTLKCWPEPFAAMFDGSKTAEFRPDDRGFCVGDYLLLREWNPDTQTYTGRSIERRITHILRNSFGIPDGFAMLSLASDGLPALIAAHEAEVARLRAFIDNPPKHRYWRAGEPDCPPDIIASNGELHTLRCKLCGNERASNTICRAQADSPLIEARNLAYGLLWNCSVDTRTVTGRCTSEARKALLATMTKADQAAGIEAARQALGSGE